MKSTRISIDTDGNLILPITPATDKNNKTIATTKFVRDAITNYATVADGSITTPKIANNSIDYYHLKNNSVAWDKLQAGAVTTNALVNSTSTSTGVTTAKIADTAVTEAKIGSSAVTSSKIADNAVTSNKISNSAVTSNKIATSAVTSNKLSSSILINNLTVSNPPKQNLTGQLLKYVQNLDGETQNPFYSYYQSSAISSDGQYQTVVTKNYILISNDFGSNFTKYTTHTKLGETIYNCSSIVMTSDGQTQIIGSDNYLGFKSTDYGVTWTSMSYIYLAKYIAMSYDGTKILYSRGDSNGNVYLSTNSGLNFSTINLPGINQPSVIAISGNGQYMIVRSNKSYISSDGGNSWNEITNVNLTVGASTSGVYTPKVCMSYTGQYIVSTQNIDYSEKTYISNDYGSSWNEYSGLAGYGASISSDGQIILINKYGSKHVYSTDGGVTFNNSTLDIPAITYNSSNYPLNGPYSYSDNFPQNYLFYNQGCAMSSDGKYFLTMNIHQTIVFENTFVTIPESGSLQVKSMSTGVVKSNVYGVLSSSTIGTSDIADGAVTSDKIDSTVASKSYVDTAINSSFGSKIGYAKVSSGFLNFVSYAVNDFNILGINYTNSLLTSKYGSDTNITDISGNQFYTCTISGLYNLQVNVDVTANSNYSYTIKVINIDINNNNSILYTSTNTTSDIINYNASFIYLNNGDKISVFIDMVSTDGIVMVPPAKLIFNSISMGCYLMNSNNLLV